MTAAERRRVAYLERPDAGRVPARSVGGAAIEDAAQDGSLRAEVEAPVVLSLAVARVVNAQARSLSVQRAISGEKAGDVIEALNRVLADLGLAERWAWAMAAHPGRGVPGGRRCARLVGWAAGERTCCSLPGMPRGFPGRRQSTSPGMR